MQEGGHKPQVIKQKSLENEKPAKLRAGAPAGQFSLPRAAWAGGRAHKDQAHFLRCSKDSLLGFQPASHLDRIAPRAIRGPRVRAASIHPQHNSQFLHCLQPPGIAGAVHQPAGWGAGGSQSGSGQSQLINSFIKGGAAQVGTAVTSPALLMVQLWPFPPRQEGLESQNLPKSAKICTGAVWDHSPSSSLGSEAHLGSALGTVLIPGTN